MTSRLFCTFEAAGHLLGVEAAAVQEIVSVLQVTRVPLTHPCVRGLMNLRGRLVTVLDLAGELGGATSRGRYGVVLRDDSMGAIALQVDAIGDVVEVPEDAYEPPLELGEPGAGALVNGAYRLPDRLLLVLDPPRAVRLGVPEAG
jgi:purine-binding chemotaxis protein CheW